MRLSHLLFLLLGIAVGLGIGMTGRRNRGRASRATREAARTQPRAAPQAERSNPESPSTPIRMRPADTSSESAALPKGMGTLELLRAGAPAGNKAWLSGTDLVGERETLDLDPKAPSELVTLTTLLAGEYLVFLEVDGELGPRTWPVTIRPGSITSIDFGAPTTPDLHPVPAGLGRVEVEVVGRWLLETNPLPG